MANSFGIFFAPLIEDMGWSRAATSAAFSINILTGGFFGIIGGWLNDRLGPRFVLPLLGLLSCLGYYFVAQMNEIWQFYLFFGLLVGMGTNVFVPCMSTIARWFVKRRGMMSGIAFSGSGFGLIVLPLMINWFINIYDWHTSLIFMSAVLLLISILAVILMRTDPYKMGLTPYGYEKTSPESNSSIKFDMLSRTVGEALKTRAFWLFAFSLMCFGFCYFAFQVHINVHAIDSGISSTAAASILTVIGIATIIGQLGLSGLGDKFGFKKLFATGVIMVILGIIVILFARDLWMFYIFGAFLGCSFGVAATQESPITAWLFGLANHGTILGIFAFSFTVGSSIGPLIFGSIYDSTGSYQTAFYIALVLAGCSLILSLFLKRSIYNK